MLPTNRSGYLELVNNMIVSTRTLSFFLLLAIIIACSILAPLPLHAEDLLDESGPSTAVQGFVPLSGESFQRLFGSGVSSGNGGELGSFVNGAFRVALSLGAILAVMRIAWAGYKYMTSDAWGTISDAKEILGDVAIGIMLLLSIWLILYQINPDLLKIQLHGLTGEKPSSVGTQTGQSGAETCNISTGCI